MLLSILLFGKLFFVLFLSYIICFPLGILFVYPLCLFYKKNKRLSYRELDYVVFYGVNGWRRIVLSWWTNSIEPMPLFGKANFLWQDKPEWLRYLLWHLRNPLSDWSKYYVGYYGDRGLAKTVYEKKGTFYMLQLKKVKRRYYPRLDLYFYSFWFMFGFLERGSPSLYLKRKNNKPF